MKNYVLVYETEYDTVVERFNDEKQLDARAEDISHNLKGEFKILLAGFLAREWKYKPVQYAVKYEKELQP